MNGDEDGARARQLDHEDMDPEDWFDVLDDSVAVHFQLAADHEWWMVYDSEGEYPKDLDGPWHLWSKYPGGTWDHSSAPKKIIQHRLDELYWVDFPEDRDSDIYRSKVVPIGDAPEFVQVKVGGEASV